MIHFTMGFRMTWFDPRIVVELNETEEQYAHLYRDQRDKFWFPDIFLLNSIDVNIPRLTLDPVFFRVDKNGMVEFSIREEMKAVCPMNFLHYPVRFKCKTLRLSSHFSTAIFNKYSGGCSRMQP